MNPIRDTLKKAAGLFVEFDESVAAPAAAPAPTKTVEQIVRDAPGPDLNEIKATPVEQRSVFRTDGSVDFDAIYQIGGLSNVPFGAEQVLQILAELPADLPLESKRATMKVTLGAMASSGGASVEGVVTDASRKLAALTTFSEGFAGQANEFTAKAEAEITRLQAEIESWKKRIDGAKNQNAKVAESCTKEAGRLDDVLEFFSLDVAPSRNAGS